MDKMMKRILWMTLGMAALFACTRTVEEDIQDPVPPKALTSIEAYFAEAPAVKTSYDVGVDGATFSWSNGDNIDVSVYNSAKDIRSYIVFKRVDAGSEDTSVEDTNNATTFTDGQDGNRTFKSLSGYVLDKWAFYPSRIDQTAQAGAYAPDWAVMDGKLYMDLPSSITPPMTNPLAVVPMVGKKDGEGKYAFTQLTGVLAFHITGLPDGADFISLTHPDVALSGSFEVTETERGAVVEYDKVVSKDDAGLTLHFADLGNEATFYFSLPVGTIPAGLTLSAGIEADSDTWMNKTTVSPIPIKRGTIMTVNVDIPYTPDDPKWEVYGTGTFKDDFMWTNNSTYQVTPTTVPVTIWRSAKTPNRYRINNPYSVAWTNFGYTTERGAIEIDEYFLFSVEDDGTVNYTALKSGFMDTYKSPAQPMMISNTGGNTKVLSFTRDGDINELQFGALYTLYNPQDDSGWKYTKGSPAPMHLTVDRVETWTKVLDGTFIDEKMWGLHSWGTTRVPIELYQSDLVSTRFRVPNPYLVAKDAFSYATYTAGIAGDEFLVFSVEDADAVKFTTFQAGIEDKTSGGKAMKVWYPSDFGSSYTVALAGNLVASYRSDGLPAEVELYPIYTGVDDISYKYTDQGTNRARLSFPEPETWNDVAALQFMDDFWVNSIAGRPKGSYVPVSLEQSNLDPKRFRIANPYPALAVAAGVASGYVYEEDVDEYLVMTVDANDLVTFGDFRPGIGRTDWEFSFCDCDYWNTQSSTTQSTGYCRVVSYDANGIPKFIDLHGVYHKIGEYNTGNRYSRATSQYADRPYIAASFPLESSWHSIGEGRFKDKLVWGIAELTEFAEVEFQQNDNYPTKFRVAKPYPGEGSGEWFVFDVANPDQVTMDKYYLDYEVTAAGKETYKPYIYDYYTSSYSKVLGTQENGLPSVVELGICYRKEPFTSYDHEIGRDHEVCAIEIVFPGCEPYLALTVTPYQSPVMKQFHHPVAKLSLPVNGTLERLVVKITGGDYSKMSGLRLYGPSGWMDSNYVAPDANGVVTMTSFTNATVNGSMDLNFWINDNSMLGSSFRFDVQEFVMSGVSYYIVQDKDFLHFPGIIVNTGGDKVSVRGYGGIAEETVSYFRIPALVTSNDGTLIAAYDVRYDGMGDLVNDIDVGVKRSTDGGKTWSDLTLAMDMGTYGFNVTDQASWKNAQKYNGIGDSCLLVDENTGRIFCFAVWTHGEKSGDTRSLAWAATGYDIEATPQFMMVYSDDDGVTWSEPVNLTRQLKKPNWRMTFQGPGRGITMADGTLVIPMQHQEGEVKNMHGFYPLNSGIAYSTDHGETWHVHNLAHPITSEACVAEIAPGTLLLSMRDETDAHTRRNYITTDLGRNWTKHASDGKLIDSTCEASMIHVNAADNVLGKDLVLFSNPKNAGGRSNFHIQASEDGGATWTHSLQIDAGGSLGYTCLTMVDNATVGILYESSRGHIVFQAIPLTDIVK